MIRLAKIEDLPDLCRMGKNFYDIAGYSQFGEYDIETVIKVFANLMKANCLLVDDSLHGMIGFVIYSLMFNVNVFVSQEVFWWVDKKHRASHLGINLLKEAERQSKELGAKLILTSSLISKELEKIDILYKRHGYICRENVYIKEL